MGLSADAISESEVEQHMLMIEEDARSLSTPALIRESTRSQEVFSPPLVAARYELFRRALLEQDDAAWETLYHCYEHLLASWIVARVTVPYDTYPALMDEIWMKLLTNLRTPEKFAQFANLGAILAYLKRCAFSVCVDYVRRLHRDDRMLVSLEDMQEEERQHAARYELFRRALLEQDDAAWETLYHCYERLLASWIAARITVPYDTYPALMDEIWMKLLTNLRTPEKFAQFANLGAILAYLKRCAFSVCVDYVRRLHRDDRMLVSLEDMQEDEQVHFWHEDRLSDGMDYAHLLRLLTALCNTEKERLMVQHLLIEGEKPMDLLARYPRVFSCIQDIYWGRNRLVERLRRSKMLQAVKEAL